jgi:lysophospholipase L1-like esterase
MKKQKPEIGLFLVIEALVLISGGCKTPGGDYGEIVDVKLPVPYCAPDEPAINPAPPIERMRSRHNDLVNNVKKNQNMVLVGDSITQRWESTGASSYYDLNVKYNHRITNLGVGGDRTGHVLWRLNNGEFPAGINPEFVVLLIGTNNLGAGDPPEAVAAGVGKIVTIINSRSPESKIILLSILPRGRDGGWSWILVSKVNRILETYDGFLNIKYYDVTGLFGDNGVPKSALYQNDYLHLSEEGYEIFRDFLMEVIG